MPRLGNAVARCFGFPLPMTASGIPNASMSPPVTMPTTPTTWYVVTHELVEELALERLSQIPSAAS